MFGMIYLIVVAAIAIASCLEYNRLRKQSRNDAMRRGHMDYVDYKGQQWYGDRRVAYTIKNEKEYLVDRKNPNIIYVDITAEKERKEADNPLIQKHRQEAYENFIRCCGSTSNWRFGRDYMNTETETGLIFGLEKDYDKYYIQPKKKSGSVFLDDGNRREISKEKYDFLKGNSWNHDTQEEFLARKKYMDEHDLFQKCGYGVQNAYRIDFKEDPKRRSSANPKAFFVCGKTTENAKQLFLRYWFKRCNGILEDSIIVTQI